MAIMDTSSKNEVSTDLFKFAYCRRKNMAFSDYIGELAEKAQKENWGTNNKVLMNYVNHTFSKLAYDYNSKEENRRFIGFSKNACCFNTGLFTEYYEPIYAYFTKNKYVAKDSEKIPWFLVGFKTPSDYELNQFSDLPVRAEYFEDAAELVFDYRIPIRPQAPHILGDEENVSRLPEGIRDMAKPLLSQILTGAIDQASKKVSANYKLAVPQFYKGKLQLLIPLTFHEGDDAQLALALKKEAGFYSARTCLTLDMAYNNARLIVKPESEWLKAP